MNVKLDVCVCVDETSADVANLLVFTAHSSAKNKFIFQLAVEFQADAVAWECLAEACGHVIGHEHSWTSSSGEDILYITIEGQVATFTVAKFKDRLGGSLKFSVSSASCKAVFTKAAQLTAAKCAREAAARDM